MASIPEPEVNVDTLMAQVRAEVARRHGDAAAHADASVSPIPEATEVQLLLDQAQWVADIGTTVPPFAIFGPFRRRLARVVTRMFYYFLQVITFDQRRFNRLVLNGIRVVSQGLQRSEAALSARLGALDEALAQQHTAITRLDRRIEALLEQAGTHALAASDGEPIGVAMLGKRHAFAAQFAEHFRGSRNEITERLRFHLRFIQDAQVGSEDRPIVDLGCGRGEWLELLRDAGRFAYGVEMNPLLVTQCRELGLDVTAADGIAHLRSLPDSSVGAVTAFHLIEHLPFPLLIDLLDEAKRVLNPGGVLVFETPNPENIIVASCHFYADPTHNRPLFPPTLHFIVEHCGFRDVQLFRLNSAPDAEPPPFLPADNALAQSVNPLIDFARSHIFVPPCFAVVGRKPL